MKESKNKCDVSSCYLCNHCIKDWLPAVAAYKKNFEVKKGQQIYQEGEVATGIYFVFAGKVKVHKRWDQEKELIVRFAKQGDVLGQLGLGNEHVYPVTATALEPTLVCYIDLDFFESSLNVNPQLTLSLMKLLANELQGSENRMRNLVHMPVKERIALSLLNLQKQFGVNESGAINIDINRQDLSSYAAVSYETLFKVTTELTQAGLIQAIGKNFKILDEAALRLIALENGKG